MPIAMAESVDREGKEAPKQVFGSTISAPVVAVEVFRHSALVHREGELAAAADEEELCCYDLPGLPLGLVDSSVRVALEPGDGPTVIDVQVALDVHQPVEQEQVEELEQLKALQRKQARLRRRRQLLEEQGTALAKLVPLLPPAPRKPDQQRFATDDPLAAWLALDGFVKQAGATRLEQARQLGQELRQLEDELKQAADRLERVSSAERARLRIGKRVRIWLSEHPTGPCRIRLSYQVPGARWFPGYELRVEPDGKRAELVMTALVAQVTGEDWRDVSVSLSTADLQRRCDLPRLGAWRIGRSAAQDRQRAWRELPADLPQLFSDFDRERPPRPAAPLRQSRPASGRASSIDKMISSTLSAAGMAPLPPEPLPGGAPVAEEEVSFSPHEITRETDLLEVEAGAVDLEQAFDDEPTPQGALEAESLSLAVDLPRGGAPPPAPPAAARPQMAKRRSPARKREERRRGAPTLGGGSASLVPSEELLAFGSLVLAGAEERGRGMLRPLRSEEQLPASPQREEAMEELQLAERRRASRLQELKTLEPPPGSRDVADSAGHFAYRYETGARAALPADGALHRLGVLRQEMESALVYRAVPAMDSAVYRVARLKNPLDLPLLAGPLDVFWGNDFLVTARLETTAAGGEIEASLGVEPRIKTARNVRHSQHEEGLLSGRTVYEDEIRVEVRNGLSHDAPVEVIERLPVSDERKVEVKPLEEQPAARSFDQRERRQPIRGGRCWKLELGPGESKECRLRYSVTLPSSSEIVGGGRRA